MVKCRQEKSSSPCFSRKQKPVNPSAQHRCLNYIISYFRPRQGKTHWVLDAKKATVKYGQNWPKTMISISSPSQTSPAWIPQKQNVEKCHLCKFDSHIFQLPRPLVVISDGPNPQPFLGKGNTNGDVD